MEEWYLFNYSVVTFRISVNGVVRWKLQFIEFAADLFQLRTLFYLPVVKNALKFTINTVVILLFILVGVKHISTFMVHYAVCSILSRYLSLLSTLYKRIFRTERFGRVD